MKNLKNAFLIISPLLITFSFYQENLYAEVKKRPVQKIEAKREAIQKTEVETQLEPQPIVKKVVYESHMLKKKYNFSAWVGVGFRFASEGLQNYISHPMFDYQIGVQKSIWHMNRYNFLYLALIYDFSYSNHFLGINKFNFSYDSLYSLSNEQLLFGVEKTFGTPCVSGFLEAGVMLAQPYLLIEEKVASNAIDFSLRPAFGGSFNGGINFNILPKNNVSYVIRLAMNLMLTTPQQKTNHFNGETINVHALTYAPVASFGVRL